MAGKFPPIRDLGGAESFADYREEFEQLYHEKPVREVRGFLVRFGRDRCEHVCYTGPGNERHRQMVEHWSQERAVRIPWVEITLRDPEEIRRSHSQELREHLAYLLSERREEGGRAEWVRFMVIVRPEKNNELQFITAFPPENKRYWDKAQTTELIYPRTKAPRR